MDPTFRHEQPGLVRRASAADPRVSCIRPSPGCRRKATLRACATVALLLATAAHAYEIRNGTVAGGGAVVAAEDLLLISTLGEPAMGTVSSGEFRLTSGFPATLSGDSGIQPIGGPIFKDGFESSGSN
jgi:hypothetical protein